jgi:tetratricopeptide (TPR) repeat protein
VRKFFASIYRLTRLSKGDVTGACADLLEQDPNDLVAVQILARHYWAHENYDLAVDYASRAVTLDGEDQEMLLIAAASTFRQGYLVKAREYALRALEAKDSKLQDETMRESTLLRLLAHHSGLKIHVQSLEAEMARGARDHRALIAWAREFVGDHQNQG